MIVSLSGFGWSGSGALLDLLREYTDIKVAARDSHDYEFTILYEFDGIRDLEYHLSNDPRINSYIAIKRFLRAASYLSKTTDIENTFKGQFYNRTCDYVNSLLDLEFRGATHYEPCYSNPFRKQYNYIVRRLGANRYSKKMFGELYEHLLLLEKSDIKVSYKPKDFLEKTRCYFQDLLSIVDNTENVPLVFDQMLPPDNPLPYMQYLPDTRVIIVRRDPRDTYLLAKCAYKASIPIPVNTVDNFITFYKKIVVDSLVDNNQNILNIQFEDLIYHYDETIKKIEGFLNISHHQNVMSRFKPSVSINNTNLSNKYKGFEHDIKAIENALSDSLYNFETAPHVDSINSKVF